ncbi:MAG: UvrD-helicase domain-containing protein [Nitrospirota bacterium]|nr:UvrD-helicase domain-containing protein [Nitrospirota bacterium]
MQDLNPQQQKAIKHINGPLLVLAGAGSGKTKVITHKFAYLVKKQKISPDSILTVTFTNKAANEMRGRISKLVGRDLKSSWIGTLHSQCGRILREEIETLGFSQDFSIYDESDRCSLIRQILKEFNIYEALYKGVSSRINFLKASFVGPEEFLSSGDGFGFDEKLARVYIRYQDELKRSNALDFDDLIMMTVKLLQENVKILEKYRNMFPYLLIDEFQDLNSAQYQFVKLLSEDHHNICAVGDDDQSIYRFRGANVQNILQFEKDFPGAKVVNLDRNYRSTQNILNVSNAVISSNHNGNEKKLWTDRSSGEKVHFCWLNTEEDEAKHIVKIIKELFLKNAHPYRDIGILYRVNLQARAIEDSLREAGLPYNIIGGSGFYHRKEIKDIIAYVRLIINPGDNISLRRIINVPPRGIGAATLSKIENEAKKRSISLLDALKLFVRNNGVASSTKEKLHGFVKMIEKLFATKYHTVSEMLQTVAEKTGYLKMLDEDKKQHVNELIASAEGKDIQEFIDRVSLMTHLDETSNGDRISLMTLHNAKGLEFPVVFVTGLEEGVLPIFKSIGNDDELAEERRLLYVGMTRAKDLLLLTGVRRRRLYSKIQEQEPSRFLKDVPQDCCHWIEKVTVPHTIDYKGLHIKKKAETKKVRPPFSSGCRVKHPVWGLGVIRDCYGDGEDQKVLVNFPDIGLKRLSLKLANLTKI